MNYKIKAKKLLLAGFNLYGTGNFDLTIDEIANVLELLDKKEWKELKDYYSYLSKYKL